MKQSSKGSYPVAIVFLVIAVVGVILSLSSPDEGVAEKVLEDQNNAADSTIVLNKTGSGFNTYYGFLRTIIVTTVIIIAILVVARILKKKMSIGTFDGLPVEIIGRKYITPKISLMMVKLDNRKLLLGITDNSVNLISEFDVSENEITTENPPVKETGFFRDVFNQIKSGGN